MKKMHLFVLIILVPAIAIGLAFLTFGWWALQPADAAATENKTFTIAPGTSTTAIANKLESEGLIRSAQAFKFVVWKEKLTSKIQAGSFQLTASDTPSEIASALTQGTEDVWVTIREGLRATEIGELLDQELANFDSTSNEFAELCLENEGYLFPETYLVPREYGTASMCNYLRSQFDLVMTDEWQAEIESQGWTQREIVILASIIEREARDLPDMKVVSGILRNRLEIGMPLQVDATLQYAKGYNENTETWWSPPTAADKAVDSPYNSYTNTGLTPGPISNPGKNALEAAIFPTANDNFYYISNSDGSEMHYAETYEQHMVNIERYLR